MVPMLEKERDNERPNIINIHYTVLSEKHRKSDVDFPLHGDEMKTQEMENFAADKSKEAEVKAN